MSDQIRRDFERLSGEPLASPTGQKTKRRAPLVLAFGSLALMLVLALALGGLRDGFGPRPIPAGQSGVCQDQVQTTPGWMWCWDKVTRFDQEPWLETEVSFHYKDGAPGKVKVSLNYYLPDEAVPEIYRKFRNQQNLEQGLLQPLIRELVFWTLNYVGPDVRRDAELRAQTLQALSRGLPPWVQEQARRRGAEVTITEALVELDFVEFKIQGGQ